MRAGNHAAHAFGDYVEAHNRAMTERGTQPLHLQVPPETCTMYGIPKARSITFSCRVFEQVDWAAHEVKVSAEYDARREVLQTRAGIVHTSGGGMPQASGGGAVVGVPPPSLVKPGGGGARDSGANASVSGRGVGDEGAASSSTPWRSREKQVRGIRPDVVKKNDR